MNFVINVTLIVYLIISDLCYQVSSSAYVDILYTNLLLYDTDEVTEKKPPFMYTVIETLLPKANYDADTNPDGGKLLEL